jgi:hypothetical protein
MTMDLFMGPSELEEAWTSWVQSVAESVAWGALGVVGGVVLILIAIGGVGLLVSRLWRGRVWCPLQAREMEVEFRERGLPGWRRAVAVERCSAFEPSTAVACARPCLSERGLWTRSWSDSAGQGLTVRR